MAGDYIFRKIFVIHMIMHSLNRRCCLLVVFTINANDSWRDHFGRSLGINACIDAFVQERRNSIVNTLELRLSCTNHRSITPKFVTPTAPLRIWIIVERVPLSLQQTRQAPTRHFRIRMSTNEYWKNSNKWIIRCHKFCSDVLIFIQSFFFFMWLRKVLIICK